MSVRDVGIRGWLLVAAAVALMAAFLALALAGLLFRPPWDLLGAGLSLAVPVVVLVAVWYLYDVAWKREVRKREEPESQKVATMATAEALLRLMDYAGTLLGRLTRYTGWFFFLVLLALIFVPLLFNLGLLAFATGSFGVAVLFGGAELVFWIAYFYFYYKVKHENDVWKERLARLREREKALLER